MTFEEYQNIAATVPIALRNDRDRIDLPVMGLQQEGGKLGKLLTTAFASGKFHLTPVQSDEAKERMADMLWCLGCLCEETGISLHDLAEHSAARLKARATEFDPDRR